MFKANEFHWGTKSVSDVDMVNVSSENNEVIVVKTTVNESMTLPDGDYTLSKLATTITTELNSRGLNSKAVVGKIKNGNERTLERLVFYTEDEDTIAFSGKLIDFLDGFDYVNNNNTEYTNPESQLYMATIKVKQETEKIVVIRGEKEWTMTRKTSNPLEWSCILVEEESSTELADIVEVGATITLEHFVDSVHDEHKYDINQYNALDELVLSIKNIQYSEPIVHLDAPTPTAPPSSGSGSGTVTTPPVTGSIKVPVASTTTNYTLDLGYSLGTPSSSTKLAGATSYNYYEITDVLGRGIIKELVYADTASSLYRMKFVAKNRTNNVIWSSTDVHKTSEGFVLKNINIDIYEPFVLGVLFVVNDGVSRLTEVNAHNVSSSTYVGYPVDYDGIRTHAYIDPSKGVPVRGKKLPIKITMDDRTHLRRKSWSVNQTVEGTAIADSNQANAVFAFYGGGLPSTMNSKWRSDNAKDYTNNVKKMYIGYNFPTPKHIRQIKLICGFNMPDLLVQKSTNGTTWTDVKLFQNIVGADDYSQNEDNAYWVNLDLPATASAKYWRIINNISGVLSPSRIQMLEAPTDYGDVSFDLDYGYSLGFAPTRTNLLSDGDNQVIIDDVITKGEIVDIKFKNYEQTLSKVHFFAVDEYFQCRWISDAVTRSGTDFDLTNLNVKIDCDFRIGIYIPESGKNFKYYKTGEKDSYWDTDYYGFPNYFTGRSDSLSNFEYGNTLWVWIAPHLELKQIALPIKVRMK